LSAIALRDAVHTLAVMDGPGFVDPPIGLGLSRPRQKREAQEEHGRPIPHSLA